MSETVKYQKRGPAPVTFALTVAAAAFVLTFPFVGMSDASFVAALGVLSVLGVHRPHLVAVAGGVVTVAKKTKAGSGRTLRVADIDYAEVVSGRQMLAARQRVTKDRQFVNLLCWRAVLLHTREGSMLVQVRNQRKFLDATKN